VADCPYTPEELRALQADRTFQDRVSTDGQLNRLFNPPADEPEERESTMRALGSGLVIAGVPVPPPTLGVFRLLSAVGSDFVKTDRRFADAAREIAVALFVLHYGPRAVAPVCAQFRHRDTIERYRAAAEKSPDHLTSILAAERKIADELAAFDAAVNRFAMRIAVPPGGSFVGVIVEIDRYLAAAMAGLDLLPQGGSAEKKTATAAAGIATMRASFSRLCGVLARLSPWKMRAGRCRS
jgi:hypothetical protein